MMEHESVFINNQWRRGSGALFSSYNPATGECLWQGRAADQREVNEAVQKAWLAFEKWSTIAIDERSHFLTEFSEVLRGSQRDFAEIISKETGKPLWEAIAEVESMINKVGISLEAYGRRCAGMIRDQPHARSITRHRPHGVVAVLGPYNFPGHLPNGHIIPALLAGNTVVFKSSEFTPLVAEKTIQYWQRVGLPEGVLNLVQGGHETGQEIIAQPNLQGLFFTGSYQTGQFLSEKFATQPEKILALEMGGNNPLVVSEIDDVRAGAYAIIQSAYLSSGQRCTCARRLIVPKTAQGDELIATLMEMIGVISIGPYTNLPEPFMGPLITEKHAQKILQAQESLRAKGGKPLVEMYQLQPGTGFISPGLMDVTLIADRPDEEIFGPFLQVIRVNDFQEAIDEANNTKFGLAAGLLSRKQEEYAYFYRHIQAGIVNWNTPLTGASSAAPFGGIKCSGNHRPSAYYAADYCAYPVASLETAELKMPTFFSPGLHIKKEASKSMNSTYPMEKKNGSGN
jgi:succinylglutamic semialdehyde dehydrogenase